MKKRMTKKRIIKIVAILIKKVEFWEKQIRRFDKHLTHPPKKYKVKEVNFIKKDDKTWEASYKCEGGEHMTVSGDFFYCVYMMNCIRQLGYYTEK